MADVAPSPSPVMTDLSKEFGAATKYHRRTMALIRPPAIFVTTNTAERFVRKLDHIQQDHLQLGDSDE
jgi:hypothetical protein